MSGVECWWREVRWCRWWEFEVLQQVRVGTWKISESVIQRKRHRWRVIWSELYSSIEVSSVNLYSVRKNKSHWKGVLWRRWMCEIPWWRGVCVDSMPSLCPTILSPVPTLKIVIMRGTLTTHSPHSSDGLESQINDWKPRLSWELLTYYGFVRVITPLMMSSILYTNNSIYLNLETWKRLYPSALPI